MPQEKNHKELSGRLESLGAYLKSIKEGPDAALSDLEGKDDADSIRRKVLILIEANRLPEAAALVRSKPPHERWCEFGVIALVLNGEQQAAKRLIEWARSKDTTLYRRCALGFANNQFRRIFTSRPLNQAITPQNVESAERIELQDLLSVIEPFVAVMRANRVVSSELDSEMLQVAIKATHLLGERKAATELVVLLATRVPIPFLVGDALLGRWIDIVPDGVTGRLRSDYSKDQINSIHAQCLAAVIDGEFLGKAKEAFDSTLGLVRMATSPEQKEEVFKVLNDLSHKLGPEARLRLDEVSPSLLKDNARFLKLLEAENFLRKGETSKAADILENNKDDGDPLWLQLKANCLVQQGNKNDAIDVLLKVCEILPHPHILQMTAELALSHRRLPDTVKVYEKLLSVEPQNIAVHHNLALIYAKGGHNREAADQFRILRSLKPEEQAYGINEAVSLVKDGKLAEALSVYSELCSVTEPRIEAVLGRAGVLQSLNRPEDAFQALQKFREKLWEHPRFLTAYLNIGFASNHEDEGHKALLQLQKLQNEGKAETRLLQSFSLEDLLKLTDEQREQREKLLTALLEGKVPWLIVEQLLQRPPYWAWVTKTQPLRWLVEDRIARAEFCIYSTNAFSVRFTDSKVRSLEELECPPSGSPTVIDQSSLITLHRLGLLGHAAEYFGKILVPSAYLSQVLEDNSHLVMHQKSQKTALEAIGIALDGRKILVLEDTGFPGQRPFPYVHEYTLDNQENEHHYRLKDVLITLREAGRIPDARYPDILSVAQKPAGADETHPRLYPSQKLWIELSTLKVLHNIGVLDSALEIFSVHVTSDDRDEVFGSIRVIQAQEEVYGWHNELWTAIREDVRFVQTPPPLSSKLPETEEQQKQAIHLEAMKLAIETNLPLLADDRVCQTTLHQSRPTDPIASYGTDRFVLALGRTGQLNNEQVADCFLKLMQWRYRFIVPTAELLKTLAARFADNPPGKPLREVARYFHDCMRDPGLFGGLEATLPPVSLAARLYVTYNRIVAEFAVSIWADARFTDTNAEVLTKWAGTELLPSSPKAMGDAGRAAMAERLPYGGMATAFIESFKVHDIERANKGLVTIARAIGLDDREYCKILTEVMDGIRKRET